MKRTLGRSGIEVSAMGLGCWAIGGPYTSGGNQVGWGDVDDDESIRAIQRALDVGVTLFDTAACYGAGHSEEILGRALGERRDEAIIATKFGHTFDSAKREATGNDDSVDNLRRSVEGSLERLQTDRVDLLQFHQGGHEIDETVDALIEALEQLVEQGKIRAYGWSTDDPDRAAKFAEGEHCTALQQQLNILEGNLETLATAERLKLASLNRGPLAKAVLTGKFNKGDTLPANDIRQRWDTTQGAVAQAIDTVDAIREVLTTGGRSPAQGAIGWLWARSNVTIPIPGFKTVKQVEENAAAMQHGPLPKRAMEQIEDLLKEAGWERQRFA